MLNGNGALDTSTHRLFDLVREELSGRRFEVLAGAISEHEARVSRFSGAPRPHDQDLYRSLREISARRGSSAR